MTTDTDIRHDKRRAAVTLNELAPHVNYYKHGVAVHVVDYDDVPVPPAPAWYTPATGDVTIHLNEAKIAGAGLGSDMRGVGWAKMRGLLWHELAHARWSDWLNGVLLPTKISGTVIMFEEMRIESRAVDKTAGYVRNDIRSVLPLSIGEVREIPPNKASVARLWALGYGRCLTTVVNAEDVEWIDEAARTLLSDETVDYLTDILQEAIALNMPAGMDRMFELATEWVDTVGDADVKPCGHEHGDESETTETADGDDSESSSGDADKTDEETDKTDTGTGEGDDAEAESGEDATNVKPSEGEPEAGDRDLGDDDSVIRDVVGGATSTPDDEPDHGDDFSEEDMSIIVKEVVRMAESVARDWNADAELTMADPTRAAADVFGSANGKAKYTRHDNAGPVEHGEVIRTAKVLEAMSIPAITKVAANKIVPPGRLRSREAVRQGAERQSGVMSTARPWQSTRRTHSHVRPIVVGIATDVSGSMRWAENSVAQFAYIWTHAGQRVGARTASVTFGDRVERVAGPGEVLTNVPIRRANGGSEKADKALAALDGVLHFSHANNAAKLLVVVSDGMLVIPQEIERVIKRLKTFRANGTEVLWVSNNKVGGDLARANVCTMVSVNTFRSTDPAIKTIQNAVLNAITAIQTKGQ